MPNRLDVMSGLESGNVGFAPRTAYDLSPTQIWRLLWRDEDNFSDDQMEVVNDVRNLYERASNCAGTLAFHGSHAVLFDGGHWFRAWRGLLESGLVPGGRRAPELHNLPSSHYDDNFFRDQLLPEKRGDRDPFLTYSAGGDRTQWEIRFPTPLTTRRPSRTNFGCLLFGQVLATHFVPPVERAQIAAMPYNGNYHAWLMNRQPLLTGRHTTSARGAVLSNFSVPSNTWVCTWFQFEAHAGTGDGGPG